MTAGGRDAEPFPPTGLFSKPLVISLLSLDRDWKSGPFWPLGIAVFGNLVFGLSSGMRPRNLPLLLASLALVAIGIGLCIVRFVILKRRGIRSPQPKAS